MPRRMIERREREEERERVKGSRIEHSRTGCALSKKIFGKSPKRRNKAQIKVDYKNYDAITMSRNCYKEIITGNYYKCKLSASIYDHAKKVGIIGILAYPKIYIYSRSFF